MSNSNRIAFISLVFLVVFLNISIDAVSREEISFLGRARKNGVEIRSGYNKNFNGVYSLKEGASIIVCGEHFSWYKVRLPSQSNCYVFGGYLEIRDKTTAISKVNRLNVRGGPDTKFGILGQLDKGDEVIIKERQGDWYKIFPTKSCYGWVYKEYIENAGSVEGFLEKEKLKTEFEKRFNRLELDYQRSLSRGDPLSALKVILKNLEDLQLECANYQDIIARLKERKDSIVERIENLKAQRRSLQSEEGFLEAAEGRIEELGKFIGKIGTHKLIQDSKTIYYLKSQDIDLNVFSGRIVKVWGIIQGNKSVDRPLFVVKKLLVFN